MVESSSRHEGYSRLLSLFLVLVCAAVFLASCQSPVVAEGLAELLRPLVASGKITQDQANEIVTAIAGGGFDWGWLEDIGKGALTLVLGYFGIRTWRGTPDARKGSAPSGPE